MSTSDGHRTRKSANAGGLWSKLFKKGNEEEAADVESLTLRAAIPTRGPVPTNETNDSNSASEESPATDLLEEFPLDIHQWSKHGADEEPTVDICFLHGLSGNYKSTWTYKGAERPWPANLIKEELPDLNARIISFGYDAYCIRFGQGGRISSNRLEDHAVSFLHAITTDREKPKPLANLLSSLHTALGALSPSWRS